MRKLLILAVLVAPLPLIAQTTDVTEQDDPDSRGVRLRFEERPELRAGPFRIGLIAKIQLDGRDYRPDLKEPPRTDDPYELNRARFGLSGRITRYFEYEAEREFKGSFGEDRPRHPWRDVFVNIRPLREFEIKVGKFKVPFGMEQNTSAAKLDFIYRSRTSDALTPGRDKGVMVHGKLLRGDRLNYEAGVFQSDGENVQVSGEPRTEGKTYAARIVGTPFRLAPQLNNSLQRAQLGISFATADVTEGAYGLRGESVSGALLFDRLSVLGRRQRTGLEMMWEDGPVGLKAELINISQERRKQGVRVDDLPDLIGRGWYVSGTVTVAGRKKAGGGEPDKGFLQGGSIGAVELAGRWEVLRFGSAENPGRPSRSPRAPNILPNSDRALTFGLNWYINHFLKFQVNGVRETIEDLQRSPIFGRDKFTTVLARLQFSM